MVAVVFVIGILNLILGFALAVLLERQIVVHLPRLRGGPSPLTVAEIVYDQTPPGETVGQQVIDQIPTDWLGTLESSNANVNSFVEAAVQVLKIESDTYRDALVIHEDLLRSVWAENHHEAAVHAVEDLVALNEEWVLKLCDIVRIMSEQRGKLGAYAAIGNRLENLLLDQSPMIEGHCQNLKNVDWESKDNAGAVAVREIGHLVRMVHELHDVVLEAQLAIVCNEGRLDSLEHHDQVDTLTGLPNRFGIELLFRNWWREDARRARHLCAALLDVDRFSRANEQGGARVGDQILATLAHYLEELAQKETGLDRVGRFGGQQFLLFFGDTGPRGAVSSVESIRQAIEATKFEQDGQEVAVTIKAGVAEVGKSETTRDLFDRLRDLVAAARHAGRNRTCTDQEDGQLVVQPPQLPVKERVIMVAK